MNNSFGAALPLLLLVVGLGVVLILPSRARARMAQRAQELQDSLTVGSEVMTTSGLYGQITALHERTLDLEIAPGVVVQWARAAIAELQSAEPTDAPPTDEPEQE